MNTSYKVALVSAIVLCAALLGYYATSGDSAGPPPVPQGQDDVPATPQPAPAPAQPAAPAAPRVAVPPQPTPPAPQPAPPTVTLPAPTATPPTIVFDGTPPPSPAPAPSPTPAQPAPAAPQPAAAPAPPDTTTYIVQPGDTMISIAEQQYGSQNYWDEIAQANPLIDPRRLKVGQVLYLPRRDAIDQRPAAPAPRVGSNVIHIVRAGQTLSHIAQEHYDDPTLWRAIYLQNRELIGSNPNRLAAGMRLEIPPKP